MNAEGKQNDTERRQNEVKRKTEGNTTWLSRRYLNWSSVQPTEVLCSKIPTFPFMDSGQHKCKKTGSCGGFFWFKENKRRSGCSTCETELLAILRRTNCRHSEILQLWISLKYQHFWASLKYCHLKRPQNRLTIPKAKLLLLPTCAGCPLRQFSCRRHFPPT